MLSIGKSEALPYYDRKGNPHQDDLEETLRLSFYREKGLAIKVEEDRLWYVDKESYRVAEDDSYFYLQFVNGEKEVNVWVSINSMKKRLHIKEDKLEETRKAGRIFQLMQSQAESLYPIYRTIRASGKVPSKQLFRLLYTAFKGKNSQNAYFLQNPKCPVPGAFLSRNEEDGKVIRRSRSVRGGPSEIYETAGGSIIRLPETTFDLDAIKNTLTQFRNEVIKVKRLQSGPHCPYIQELLHPVFEIPVKEGRARFAGTVGRPISADLYQLWGGLRRTQKQALIPTLIKGMLLALRHLQQHQIIHFGIDLYSIYWNRETFQLGEFGKARSVEEITEGESSFFNQRNWKELPGELKSELTLLAATKDPGLIMSGFYQFDLYCLGRMLWNLTDQNRNPSHEVIPLLQFENLSNAPKIKDLINS